MIVAFSESSMPSYSRPSSFCERLSATFSFSSVWHCLMVFPAVSMTMRLLCHSVIFSVFYIVPHREFHICYFCISLFCTLLVFCLIRTNNLNVYETTVVIDSNIFPFLPCQFNRIAAISHDIVANCRLLTAIRYAN